MPLNTGQVLQNRYRIVSLLGQGGMGAVYRAWHLSLSAPVALKEMIPQPGLDATTLAQLRQQFQQEAQTLARLSHPHLVRVTDFFEEGGNAYLVMDFVEGESLAHRIERQGALPEAQVLAWAGQLLDALAYCHAQGIIHRDVKPQNVIIRPDGRAVLVDFGLVKLWDPRDPRTRTAMRGMGTPEYAPLEQYGSGHTDPRSDLYSLGATLYHALTGQAPLTATERVVNPKAFWPPRALVPGIRPSTEAAVLRAMEIQPDARFQSAAEMGAALLGGTAPVVGTVALPGEVAMRVAVPLRRAWAWALLGIVLLVGLIGWAVWQQQRAQEQEHASATAQAAQTTATAQAVAIAQSTPTPAFAQAGTPYPQPAAAISPENAAQVTQLARCGKGTINQIAWLPDGQLLAVASSLGVYLYDAQTLTEVRFIETDAWVSSVAFSPDGALVASGSGDATVRLWGVSDGAPLRTLEGHTYGVRSVAFSPDGALVASGSWDKTVRLWRVADGAPLRTLEGHTYGVTSVAFSPDGALVASGSDDATVRLWRVSDGAPLRTLARHTAGVKSVAFSPDGALLASGSDDTTVRLWRVSDGAPLRTLEGHTAPVRSVAFSPDGALLASGSDDTTVRLWRVSDGASLHTLEGHTGWVESVAFSPDGALLASGSGDTTVRLWRVSDGAPLRTLEGHTAWVSSVAFSPDGALVASGSADATVRLWGVR